MLCFQLTKNPEMKYIKIFLSIALLILVSGAAYAHGVDEDTQTFLSGNSGVAFVPFLYIGAKHMLTGYDHLLFLVGVIFFLYRPKEVLLYVSFFTIGHSITLLLGVLADMAINAYLIDAIIALSIVYKGFDNLGGFQRFLGRQPNTKAAVLIFGLFHGFGLASKLQELSFDRTGLLTNLLGFNTSCAKRAAACALMPSIEVRTEAYLSSGKDAAPVKTDVPNLPAAAIPLEAFTQ